MAKNSAKSKGYRKTAAKKPYISKKEILTTLAVVGAAIIAVALFMLLHNDGFISAKQIEKGDIVAYASASNRNRFLKLAEVNELDGYTMTETVSANGMTSYSFNPDAEDTPLDFFFISTSNQEASALAETVTKQQRDMLANNATAIILDPVKTSVQGHDAYLLAHSYDYFNSDLQPEAAQSAEAPASNTFLQNMTLYVDCGDAHTLVLHVYLKGEDNTFHIAESEIEAYVLGLTDSFTLTK